MKKTVKNQFDFFCDESSSIEPHKADWLTYALNTLKVPYEAGWPDRFGQELRSRCIGDGRKPIRTLSLFSGGGGLDIGFHDAGFEIKEAVEIDERFSKTLIENSKPNELLEGTRITCADIRDYVPKTSEKIDFIIGGPPCQTFSAAGRRASGVMGTDDPRGTLFEEYVRVLKVHQPKGFLFENVYGIVGAQGGGPWREIQAAFNKVGYRIFSRILDAADYGVPQHRERLIIVGVRVDLSTPFQFPVPICGPDSVSQRSYYTAGEAVDGAQTFDDKTKLSVNGRWGHLLRHIPPGLNYSFFTAELGHPTPVFAWRSKFSDFMYKADPSCPVRTIKAQGGLYTGPLHWENRHFSVSETKRLQTFPDCYKIIGTRQVAIHQLGNSVPPQFARMLALCVREQLFGAALPISLQYLKPHQHLGFRTRKRLLTEVYAKKAKQAISKISDRAEARDVSSYTKTSKWSLSEAFELGLSTTDDSRAIKIRERVSKSSIRVAVDCAKSPKAKTARPYELTIVPKTQWPIPQNELVIQGIVGDERGFVAAWKRIEQIIRELYGIDDLVQLSGYYQYAPKIRIKLTSSSKMTTNADWKVLLKVVEGFGVGANYGKATLSEMWGVNVSKIDAVMSFLRSVGYEVRNSNTNPQITKGQFLLPYSFPSLTSRSVQLRKSLT